MPISAYEYARTHIPLALAKQYTLTKKKQNPKTLRKGQNLLGIEIKHQAAGSYPIITIHCIKVLGFCEQGLFSEKVSRPSKKVRVYKEHPIDSDCLSEMITSLSQYRKEHLTATTRGGDYANYEPPTMVAQSLLPSKKPYILLQANDTLDDGLSWKNGKSEITWFGLKPTMEITVEEIATPNENAPYIITRKLRELDHFAHVFSNDRSYKDLEIGAVRRPHQLKQGEKVAITGEWITTVENGNKPAYADYGDYVAIGVVRGFAKASAVSPYLQPTTFAELKQRISQKRKVQFFDAKKDQPINKMMAGLRWNEEHRTLIGHKDLSQEVLTGKWTVYPTWNDIPQELLQTTGGIADHSPKIVLLLADPYTTEINAVIDIHIPSLQAQHYNQPMEIYALYNVMKGKQCIDCGETYPQVEFDTMQDSKCCACEKKSAVLAFAPTTLLPLLNYIYTESIQTQTLDSTGLYIKIAYGDGTISSYFHLLDQSFVRQKAEWIDELQGDFSFACERGGKAREYVSEDHRATLRLIYDNTDGMEAELWIDPIDDTDQNNGGAQ